MPLPTTTELAAYTLAQQHPIINAWAPAAERLQLLAAEHQIDLDLSTDEQLATARRERFAPEQPTEMFFNVWGQASPGLQVMLSIRYEDGNPQFPFVDVSATSRPLTSDADLADVAALAGGRYGILNPLYLRWWTRQPAFAVPGVVHDKRFLAAPLHELANHPTSERLTVNPSKDLSNYDRAVAAYQSIDHAHPEHPRQAMIESVDDLAELQRGGTLFDVVLDNQWAGYVAAQPGHKLGLAGYKIAELVLTDRARGHGYGQYLTTLVSQELLDQAHRPDGVLIGTIHQHNTGALHAARRSGRHDIGGWITRPLA